MRHTDGMGKGSGTCDRPPVGLLAQSAMGEQFSPDTARQYRLIGTDGNEYISATPGELGGHKGGKLYGKLDCASALRAISNGGYVPNRVFFHNETVAIAAGYRPCARCMPSEYAAWKSATAAASVHTGRMPVDHPVARGVRASLTPDLLKPEYRDNPAPYAGHCYATSEAYYHLMGGRESGWKPTRINHEGSPHWFLRHGDGSIMDLTAEQFRTPVPYEEGVGCGFLTRQPSKRARSIIDRLHAAGVDC